MNLRQIVEELGLEVRSGASSLDKEVSGGYASDLLSDVIGNAKEGEVWITLQIHENIVAVAALKELTGIIIVNSREPEQQTLEKAGRENLAIMVTGLPAFEIIGKVYGRLGGS